ncbi:hypothetical protein C463_16681 [Halorubrum californiense DSM 19288]|uniref:CAAX prenyl protease 2/Lysostaphin resistance protein A-like domain-containing protein n=1 Tax=Halorubrum californiense DSM 19288 TaxID=1227465 RepID=M0DY21_9EURY|nr:type II CAAX endopeptidase family protein [Halorubrum californiense]ELZ39698.1 hypothetical protein C463_16681 [Halorubrum californiense DSM 19288]
MAGQTQPFHRQLQIRTRCQSFASATILAAFGVIAGFISFILVDPVYAFIWSEWASLGNLLGGYGVQPGMGVVALAYIWWKDDYNPLDRIRTPTTEGIGWIVFGVLGYEIAVRGVTRLLPIFGLTHEGHNGEAATWQILVEQPELIIPGLVIMFVIMAPLEELLYRGVIHETLTGALGSRGRVLVSALLFGGIHVFLSGGFVSLLFTSIFGLILGAAYERTENLAVPILTHAGFWLVF